MRQWVKSSVRSSKTTVAASKNRPPPPDSSVDPALLSSDMAKPPPPLILPPLTPPPAPPGGFLLPSFSTILSPRRPLPMMPPPLPPMIPPPLPPMMPPPLPPLMPPMVPAVVPHTQTGSPPIHLTLLHPRHFTDGPTDLVDIGGVETDDSLCLPPAAVPPDGQQAPALGINIESLKDGVYFARASEWTHANDHPVARTRTHADAFLGFDATDPDVVPPPKRTRPEPGDYGRVTPVAQPPFSAPSPPMPEPHSTGGVSTTSDFRVIQDSFSPSVGEKSSTHATARRHVMFRQVLEQEQACDQSSDLRVLMKYGMHAMPLYGGNAIAVDASAADRVPPPDQAFSDGGAGVQGDGARTLELSAVLSRCALLQTTYANFANAISVVQHAQRVSPVFSMLVLSFDGRVDADKVTLERTRIVRELNGCVVMVPKLVVNCQDYFFEAILRFMDACVRAQEVYVECSGTNIPRTAIVGARIGVFGASCSAVRFSVLNQQVTELLRAAGPPSKLVFTRYLAKKQQLSALNHFRRQSVFSLPRPIRELHLHGTAPKSPNDPIIAVVEGIADEVTFSTHGKCYVYHASVGAVGPGEVATTPQRNGNDGAESKTEVSEQDEEDEEEASARRVATPTSASSSAARCCFFAPREGSPRLRPSHRYREEAPPRNGRCRSRSRRPAPQNAQTPPSSTTMPLATGFSFAWGEMLDAISDSIVTVTIDTIDRWKFGDVVIVDANCSVLVRARCSECSTEAFVRLLPSSAEIADLSSVTNMCVVNCSTADAVAAASEVLPRTAIRNLYLLQIVQNDVHMLSFARTVDAAAGSRLTTIHCAPFNRSTFAVRVGALSAVGHFAHLDRLAMYRRMRVNPEYPPGVVNFHRELGTVAVLYRRASASDPQRAYTDEDVHVQAHMLHRGLYKFDITKNCSVSRGKTAWGGCACGSVLRVCASE